MMRKIPDRRVQAYYRRREMLLKERAIVVSEQTKAPEASTPIEQVVKVQTKAPSVWRELASLGIKIMLIVISFTLIFTFVYGFHRNTDPDMNPLIKDGDLVMFYRFDQNYAIGDLLLLDFQGERQVRRVVARAGDTVDITEDGLVINGALQQESEIYQHTWRYETGVSFPLTVGAGQVFVLGDARERASDSRVYGPVDTKDTFGTVITVIRRRNL